MSQTGSVDSVRPAARHDALAHGKLLQVSADEMITRAEALSASLLTPLVRRWAHVQQVARRACELAPAVDAADRAVLIASAWLHDIGYAPPLVVSGFHAVDGARFLVEQGWPDVLVQLVAHHTGAWSEAIERGLGDELAAFPRPPGKLLDALTAADMTVGPDGTEVTAAQRLAEILTRYGPNDAVHRAVSRSAPELSAAVRRTEERLHQQRPAQPT